MFTTAHKPGALAGGRCSEVFKENGIT